MRAIAAVVAVVALASVPLRADSIQPATEPSAILVSRQLAARAHLKVGDIVTFAAAADGTGAARFRVAGVYEPTPDPMRFTAERLEARMHLPALVEMTADPADPASREVVGGINVKLASAADARAFAADVATRVPGLYAQSTSRSGGGDPFVVLERFHIAISAVTMVGSTAFLLALMIIRAEERRETVGILRLVGISRRTLLSSVAIEGVLVAAIGAVFGIVIAYLSQGLVNRIFQARYDTALVFLRVTPTIAVRAILVAAPLGVIAGVGASWTLLRRNVLSIIRR
jgi:ABC-type lipoprotein release transport system permease subunit